MKGYKNTLSLALLLLLGFCEDSHQVWLINGTEAEVAGLLGQCRFQGSDRGFLDDPQASEAEYSFEEVFPFLDNLDEAKMVMDAIDGNLRAPTFWVRYLRGGETYQVLSDTSFQITYETMDGMVTIRAEDYLYDVDAGCVRYVLSVGLPGFPEGVSLTVGVAAALLEDCGYVYANAIQANCHLSGVGADYDQEEISALERSLCDEEHINEDILEIQEMCEDTGKCLFKAFNSGAHLERCKVK